MSIGPPCPGRRSASGKTLLGVLAATIRGSSHSHVRLGGGLPEYQSPSRRSRPVVVEYKFSCYGVNPVRDDSVVDVETVTRDGALRGKPAAASRPAINRRPMCLAWRSTP